MWNDSFIASFMSQEQKFNGTKIIFNIQMIVLKEIIHFPHKLNRKTTLAKRSCRGFLFIYFAANWWLKLNYQSTDVAPDYQL